MTAGSVVSKPSNKIKRTRDQVVFNAITYPLLALLALVCLLPFWLIVSASFTDNSTILVEGYSLIPKVWSLDQCHPCYYGRLCAEPEGREVSKSNFFLYLFYHPVFWWVDSNVFVVYEYLAAAEQPVGADPGRADDSI